MPDEFLTVDEAAQRLALPPEMIRRRIESGDIPVHWVEVDGKLEMRVAAHDMSGLSEAEPTPQESYSPPDSYSQPESYSPQGSYAPQGPDAPQDAFATSAEDEDEESDESPPSAGAPASGDWNADQEPYAPNLWTPVEETSPQETNPWEISQPDDLSSADDGPVGVPVWRPDPATWEDEPLDSAPSPAGQAYAPLPGPYSQSNLESEEDEEEVGGGDAEPVVSESATFTSAGREPKSPGPFSGFGATEDAKAEEFATPAAPEYEFEPSPSTYQSTAEEDPFETVAYEQEVEEEVAAAPLPSPDELTPPSALAASQLTAGSIAINSIDARELVAGLFERWERALEQRIQAEQRLRFEAELEQRLRQVRDLRQELDQTRKTQAAQMAEREREMMELRNKVRELEKAPKGRGLFRR